MTVHDLWTPIIASGVATHILSTLNWTVLPHHKPEWNRLPNEDQFIDALHAANVPANQYMVPFAETGAEAQAPEFQARQAKCRGMLILWDAPLNMGTAIGQTLGFFLFAAFCIGYLASLGLVAGAPFLKVFQFVTTAGLLAHCYAHFPHVFWFKRRIALEVLDGIVYAVATGLIFAALWPSA